jgi:ABC-type multidrug transport system permease subunit
MHLRTSLRLILVICRHTIVVWLRNRSLIAASLVPPLAFLVAGFFAAAAVSHSPVALVNLDQGAQGQLIAKIFHDSNVFRITDTDPAQARQLIKGVRVAAVITIPADFTEKISKHQATAVDFEVNNLNLDFTNDIRRSVPAAITQYYQTQGLSSPIKVTMQEQDLRHRDIELFQYQVVPVLLLMILITGLVNTTVSTAREYEMRTIKEVLLAPVSDRDIALGKILAGFLIGLCSGILEVAICLALKWLALPPWQHWPAALLVIALTSLMAAGAGFAVGVWVKKIQAAHALSTNTALPLFFLAGGVGVLAFEPEWLQNIAAFVPLTYANHALQMAFFYNSTDQLAKDVAVLVSVTVIVIVLSVSMVRKSRSNFG